jgi:uncharacterized protein YbaR (Trm112 family)
MFSPASAAPWRRSFLQKKKFSMISQDLLDILRCPMDPSHTRLTLEEQQLVCERCKTRFPIKDGLPVLVIEEAELPSGCASIEQLPCQQVGAKT